ncbi:MAG: MBL fold metallo-hydrolase [Clostridiaceae bacterium]|nr:MBL fold metallo-hydrolase [Clostridiaceae bacterium]
MGYFCTFASGSSGNCAFYMDGRARVLIDGGTNMKHIDRCLRTLGRSMDELTHILITHGHSDHISALPVLLKHTRATVVCTEGTAEYLCALPLGARVETIATGHAFELCGCPAVAFPTPHDAEGSCGFVMGEGHTRVGICTDLGMPTSEAAAALIGCRVVLLESNHDVEMLKHGPYPIYLKRRILSERGHLSNEDSAKLAQYLAVRGTEHILLAHLSAENNTPELALRACRAALVQAGCTETEAEVPPRSGLGQPIAL